MSASQHPGAAWFGVAPRSGGSSSGGRHIVGPLSAVAAASMIAGSYFLPWWSFVLYAPQYPGGLRLVVSLNGVSGDVHEVNMLNHYIGMKSLELAAPFERAVSGYALSGLVLGVLLCGLWTRRRLLPYALGLAAFLPLGFLVDSWFWLIRFGHQLDPRAPIRLPSFTPQLFGNGVIGQFMTFAQPGPGFWLAVFAVAALLLGYWLGRSKQPQKGLG